MSKLKLFFSSSLLMSLISSISSNSWFQIWMSLELNMLSFIPLIYYNTSSEAKSMLKYFIIQSLASSFFLVFLMTFPQSYFSLTTLTTPLIMSIKLGVPPLYFWLPDLSMKMKYPPLIVLLTLQKVTPLYICSLSKSFILPSLSLLSSVIGALSILKSFYWKEIMAFSSLVNMGWMIFLVYNSINWTSFWIIYSTSAWWLMMFLFNKNIESLTDYNNLTNSLDVLNLLLLTLMLGGMPPMMSFLTKLIGITNMHDESFLIMFLLFSSLASLSSYLNMVWPSLMMKKMLTPVKTSGLNFIVLMTSFWFLLYTMF